MLFKWSEFKKNYLIKFWSATPAVVIAGIMSAYYFGLTGTFWAVTGEFTRWGGHIIQWFGGHPETWTYFKIIGFSDSPLDRIDGIMIIGMFAGCLSAALWANNIKFRNATNPVRIIQAVVGGIIAGFGARLAMGCNLAAFFTGIPQFSLHAWFFAVAMAAGAYLGAKCMLLPILNPRIKAQKISATSLKRDSIDSQRINRRFHIGVVVFVTTVLAGLYLLNSSTKLGFALLFGAGFGVLIERSQLCFTSAFRDLWLTGRTYMAKAILLGMAVSAIGVFSYVQLGVAPKIMWAGPGALIGGLLFGFGIVLAGGCETGWMYRAVEGQVHFWWVGLGNLIGALLLAYVWDDLAPTLVDPYSKINLLESFGATGGLIVTYLLFALCFIFLVCWEKYYFRHSKH